MGLGGVSGTQLLWYATTLYGAAWLGSGAQWEDAVLHWVSWGGYGLVLPFMCTYDVMVDLGGRQSSREFLLTTVGAVAGLGVLCAVLLFCLAAPGAPVLAARGAAVCLVACFVYLNTCIPRGAAAAAAAAGGSRPRRGFQQRRGGGGGGGGGGGHSHGHSHDHGHSHGGGGHSHTHS